MANLRIIHDNAADRATLVAGGTLVSGMGTANLTANAKSRVCRSINTYWGLNAQFATPEPINAVALMFTNVSPTATIRMRATAETSTTNYCFYSEQFDNAAWQKSGMSIAVDTIAAPNGGLTAERFTATNNDGYMAQVMAAPAGVSYVGSVWLKSTVNRTINLYLGGGSTANAVTTQWQRFYVNCVPLVGGSISFQISGGGILQTGAILDVWGAQVEKGLIPSSYYPTPAGAATVRPTGYIDNWQGMQYDSLSQPAVLAKPPTLRGWTPATQASAYAYGGGVHMRHWMPTTVQATGIRVDVGDDLNLQGYVEVSRLIVGQYWSPEIGAVEGSTMTVGDTSKQYRTEAGDQYTDIGTRFRKQSISLPSLNEVDRAKFWEILWGNGMTYPIFVSMYPANADPKLEQAHEIYGKLQSMPIMGTPYFNHNSATVEIEEI